MTVDERQGSQDADNQPADENHPTSADDASATDDALDIENALASIAILSDVVAAHEADEAEAIAQKEAEQAAKEAYAAQRGSYHLPEPELMILKRGQIASVVPALLLIALGAWLTFTLTTDAAFPSDNMLFLILASVFGFSLMAYWLASARWSRGALFGGLSVLALGATLFVLTESSTPGADGWPLLISAFGASIILSALLSYGNRTRTIAIGFLLFVAGVIGAGITTSTIDSEITNTIETIGPALLVIVLLVFLLPSLARLRRT